jgi:hypothetical protein
MYSTSRVKKKNMLLEMLATMLYSVNAEGISVNIKTHYTAHGIGGLKYFLSNTFLCSTCITIWHEFQNTKNMGTLTQNWAESISLWILTDQFSTPKGKNLLQTAHIHSLVIKSVIKTDMQTVRILKLHDTYLHKTILWKFVKQRKTIMGKNCYSMHNL